LKQHTETLEVRVRERTAALEHLNGELKAAAQQKAQFFAHFSHEIRTPLNSILGFSEMLRTDTSGPLTERQRRFVQHVHDSGSRLLRLINDILDLAKVEAGKLSLQVVPTSLRRVVEQAAGAMQPQAQSKQVRLLAAVPDGLPSVSADPARIHQVLLNLLSNAIKFTAEGGSVDVTAVLVARADGDAAADPQPVVEISVRDTGVGIAPADQARLFRDFEQVADGAGQGTGLGLSLTRRLVALHGGQVGIESVLGEGSRFWFTLPVAAPGAEVAAEAIRHGR
jgi:signal transduction histidine kinase